MCGIFCLFLNRPLTEADINLGRSGSTALAHRGPDGHGEWIDRDAGVFLGHRRLAIVDPSSASDQPMEIDGSVLTFNGEIYNFKQLRGRLKKSGAQCRTRGDVEVLLRAWQVWGEASLDLFDGMFAFAIWDRRQAHLVTDPFGEKPLFYAETPDGLYVSSEIAPLANLLMLEPSIKGEILAAYLSMGFVPPPDTAYPNIKRMGAAGFLRVENGRVVDRRKYWTAPVAQPGSGPVRPLGEKDLDVIQETLAASLEGRLYADVPLCMFLSRGIDSSLVAAMATKDLGANLNCLTVSYSSKNVEDEGPAASKIADYIGAEHEIITVGARANTVDPIDVIDIFGQPCESTTALAIRQMSAAAAKSYKTGLTGTGGDEVFFGYGKNAHFYRRRLFYGLPQSVRMALKMILRPFAGQDPRLARLVYDALAPDAEQYLANKNFPSINWLRQLDGFYRWSRQTFGGKGHIAYAMPKIEFDLVLPGQRVVTFDHSSMAASLELRTPFLSRRLVETVATFDPRSFIAFGQKSVLRRLLSRYLPDHLFDFPKGGFYFPQNGMPDTTATTPQIPGVPVGLVNEVFNRRSEGAGWDSLAVRLESLNIFLQGPDGDVRSPATPEPRHSQIQ